MAEPLRLHADATPQGLKVCIMLEECGLPYALHAAADADADGDADGALLQDPQGPDGAPLTVRQADAILLYLADKTGRLLPAGQRQRAAVLQWLMFEAGSVAPMLQQARHYRHEAPQAIAYAVERYTAQARRLYAALERQLAAGHGHIAGRSFTLADLALYPWLRGGQDLGLDWADHPRLHDWCARIAARPAVRRAEAKLGPGAG